MMTPRPNTALYNALYSTIIDSEVPLSIAALAEATDASEHLVERAMMHLIGSKIRYGYEHYITRFRAPARFDYDTGAPLHNWRHDVTFQIVR